jgi:hypothetical protein
MHMGYWWESQKEAHPPGLSYENVSFKSELPSATKTGRMTPQHSTQASNVIPPHSLKTDHQEVTWSGDGQFSDRGKQLHCWPEWSAVVSSGLFSLPREVLT